MERESLAGGLGVLVTDGHSSLEQLRHYKLRPDYVADVMKLIRAKGTVAWEDYRVIKERHGARRGSLLGLVLKQKLAWDLWPFRLALRG